MEIHFHRVFHNKFEILRVAAVSQDVFSIVHCCFGETAPGWWKMLIFKETLLVAHPHARNCRLKFHPWRHNDERAKPTRGKSFKIAPICVRCGAGAANPHVFRILAAAARWRTPELWSKAREERIDWRFHLSDLKRDSWWFEMILMTFRVNITGFTSFKLWRWLKCINQSHNNRVQVLSYSHIQLIETIHFNLLST